MIKLDNDAIKRSILQRDPILMVDEIIEIEPGKLVRGLKHVTGDEPFFKGHFPGDPIMPGTMIVEAMAQASTFLFYEPDNSDKKLGFFLGAIKDMRFLKVVVPVCDLMIKATPVRMAQDSAYVSVEASVKGDIVSKGELIFVRRKS